MENDDKKGGLTKLEKAFREAMAFNVSNIRKMNMLSEKKIEESIEEDVASGRVDVLDNGLTVGMSYVIMEPVHNIKGIWDNLYNNFTASLQPYLADIKAVDELYNKIENIKLKKDEDLRKIDEREASKPGNDNAYEQYESSKIAYDAYKHKYKNRNAVMFARGFLYWVIIFLVLLTESFINFSTFSQFWSEDGFPLVALGTTVVLGVLMALASHLHGELIKQWPFWFARSKPREQKNAGWRKFALADAALIAVLLFTGWSRWAVALQSDAGPSLLRHDASNPVREVLISLIANVGVWILGVIISYCSHDNDPAYMTATKQFHEHRKIWEKVRNELYEEREQIKAKADEDINDAESTAETKLKNVKRQYDMKQQVEKRGNDIKREIENITHMNINAYKSMLIKKVKEGGTTLSFFRSGTEAILSPPEFERMAVSFSE